MQGPQAASISSLIFPISIFLIFYFLVIRPQQKEKKEHQKMVNKLNKNDEVITSGGIHATVVNAKEKTVTLRIDDNVKIEVEKSCISVVKKSQSAVSPS